MKLWFAAKYENYIAQDKNFVFNSDAVPNLKRLEQNADIIKNEFYNVINNKDLFSYYFEKELYEPIKTWDTLPLYVFGSKRMACKHFPKTVNLIDNDESIVSVFFSRVSGESHIKPHSGITNGIFRCHMGIQIPSFDSKITGMRVGNQFTAWQEGKFFAFLDSNYHETWNKSDNERIILIIDIIRPEFRHLKYYMFSRIYLSYAILKLYELLNWKLIDAFAKSKKSKILINLASILCIPFVVAMSLFSYYRFKN